MTFEGEQWLRRRSRTPDQHQEEPEVATDEWSKKAEYMAAFFVGLAVTIVILALIAWGYSSTQGANDVKRARAEACRSVEGASSAEVAVCIQAAGG